jgi:ribonucleoside-diphosphate reductase alpha chain
MLCGCGTGIGLSNKFMSRLPHLVTGDDKTGSVVTYVIEDTIEGWADSLEALLQCYFRNNPYTGRKIIFDYSKIRRKGSLLKTGGGRAPGYKPLKAAHQRIKKFLDKIIEQDNVRILRPIHAYDILMFFADAVLSGGIRRTASCIIFDKTDDEMMNAKTFFKVDKVRESIDSETGINHLKVTVNGHSYDVSIDMGDKFDKFTYDSIMNQKTIGWKYIEPQRARSNNSVRLIRSETSFEQFASIIEKSRQFGEPGFAFTDNEDSLQNPCFEISFMPITKDGECGVQFCNLTTANGRMIKNMDDFLNAAKAQAIIGTLQAGYTNFPYLGKASQMLTEEEALIGCSITGILTNPKVLLEPANMTEVGRLIVQVNKVWAAKIGINAAARPTALKPEGTGSLVIGVQEPGAHAAHAKYFFRRIQVTKGDTLYEYFKVHNPHMCEESKWSRDKTDDVITFPLQAEPSAIVKDDLGAIEHLEIIKKIQRYWIAGPATNNKKPIQNSVSCTVVVKEDEWQPITRYIYDNKQDFTAISLLDYYGDKNYEQAPLEKIVSEEEFAAYYSLIENYKPVDYVGLIESNDETTRQQEAACSGGACLI